MKRRITILGGTNLFCLLFLLIGRQYLQNAQAYQQNTAPILIEAVYYDSYGKLDAGEAVALRNPGITTVDIGGWQLSDVHYTTVILPDGIQLKSHDLVWLTSDSSAFQRQFGHKPDIVLSKWPGFANDGDEVQLRDRQGAVVDAIVYGDGDPSIAGWHGPALQPYVVRSVFGKEGQILYRKLDQETGLPVSDNDQATDWAQDNNDPFWGHRVRYPGWDLEAFFFPVRIQESGTLTISVAPDNAFETVSKTIIGAHRSIKISSLTFENLAIGQELIRAAERGVSIRVLLEGTPVGGIRDTEKAICQKLESAGGQCWFMINDPEDRVFDRYRYMHAKTMIVDDRTVLISSENLSPNSMPYDDKSDGTWGRRGIVLMTDAQQIVDAMNVVYASDLDPANHKDMFRWRADHPHYGAPSPSYIPIQSSGGTTYTVRYPTTAVFHDATSFELQQAPENLLRDADGALGLINQAGEGDTLLVQQLQERPYWGASTSNREQDPNIRLEAFVNAARRGASVRLLLDRFFDADSSQVGNAATCNYLNDLSRQEKLDLECTRANPTGLGIHNKMILAHVKGRGYALIGSWNGTETSSKGNREITLLVQSNDAYVYLAELFERDWPHEVHLPLLAAGYHGVADHILISEVLYDPYGPDETEFIELVNPMSANIDISDFSIGDAVAHADFEDVRRFPDDTVLHSGEVIVIATSGRDFWEEYGQWPDFEILETSPDVANLVDDPAWGDTKALLQLGNQGDEVILRNTLDEAIDVLVYGDGAFPGQTACELLAGTNHSLERVPYWRDSDRCPSDFRDWPFPSPGLTP